MSLDAISTARARRTKSVRIGVVLLAAVIAVLFAGWLARDEILRGMARSWMVSDPVVPADAVAVLGGGLAGTSTRRPPGRGCTSMSWHWRRSNIASTTGGGTPRASLPFRTKSSSTAVTGWNIEAAEARLPP
jgi:hypothetical protein